MPDGVEDRLDLGVVFLLEFIQLSGELFVGCQHFPEPHKGPYDMNAGLHCGGRAEDAGLHDCPVFGERVGKGRRKPERPEVITNCDHLRFLRFRELEHEVLGKAIPVPFHRLIEDASRNTIERCQVGIQQDPLTADGEDSSLHVYRRGQSAT